jgi:hypothetical protein
MYFQCFGLMWVGKDIHHVYGGKNLDDIYIGTLWKWMCGVPHSKWETWNFEPPSFGVDTFFPLEFLKPC